LIKRSDENPVPNSVAANELPIPSLSLSADEVHIWNAKLDDHAVDRLRALLSVDEIDRADRFHFAKHRNHFVVARGLLRKLLGAYLRTNPGQLQFAYAEKGKPSLKASRKKAVNFNLAHSHGRAIYAFSRNREIGVDIEFIREDLASLEIANRFFSKYEISQLMNVPDELKKQAFFNCWTRKEAYIKARGEGLSLPLDEFDVSLLPGEAAALLRNHKEPDEAGRWTMQSVSVPEGYVAALVVEGQDWRLRSFDVKQLAE